MKILCGMKVKDTLTNLKGVVIGRAEWLHECTTIGVKPRELHEGKVVEAIWIPEARCEQMDS